MNPTIMWKEIGEQPEALKRCEEANRSVIRELAQHIREFDPSCVIIAARGTSDHVATYAKYLIEIYCHIPVCLSAPSVMTLYGSPVDMSRCLVIGISQSGMAEDVLEVMQTARKQGAVVVGVTNEPDSRIARNCDYHLYCAAGPEKSVAATKTFTMQLYLMTLLVEALSSHPVVRAGLEKIPQAVESALALESRIEEKSACYRLMNECFVLSRGLLYPLAMETALKIQETCYIRARAYAVSDFQHGPFAMVDRQIPVILLAADEHSDRDIVDMIHRLKEQSVDILLITNKQRILDETGNGFKLPDGCEGIPGAFACGVIAQMFACSLAVRKGNNPDAPRGLRKVTITR